MPILNLTRGSYSVRTPAGASFSFSIRAQHNDGTPFDLTGYAVSAPLLTRDNLVPPVEAFSVEQTDASTLTLSLDETQTELLRRPSAPVTWPWCVWIAKDEDRTQLARGGLTVSEP